ncbi:MAG: ABC transporter ATP-binding protein [Chloroflexi bacterium HGW-Chloroflexi-3]|nr:MAG: ABC transporter ATP-binding protein [Chloroflexi bacterium HGW-Chloroflexi-3]
MNESASIIVQNLDKFFGKQKALKNVNLSITKGQIYGLLGPNGAGKTTLIRCLIGATKPTKGSLMMLGFNPTSQKTQVRGLIGYMPQTPALYEDLTAFENIRFFSYPHQKGNFFQRINEVIEFVGLTKRAHDQVYKFSGGMKQRVSLACALVHYPQILFLDEPTTGIDPKLRESFWQHFRDLTQQGTTILVSTHQMGEAMYCDRLAILHEGTLLADEPPRQLLWKQQAKIKLRRNNMVAEKLVSHYPDQLPKLLHKLGLDPAINRIEIEEETLESVVLKMINEHEKKLNQEGAQ